MANWSGRARVGCYRLGLSAKMEVAYLPWARQHGHLVAHGLKPELTGSGNNSSPTPIHTVH